MVSSAPSNTTTSAVVPCTETMPCAPTELSFRPYLLPDTLGRGEREEGAARVLIFSQEAGQWVGVRVKCLVERMQEEHEAIVRWRREMEAFQNAEDAEWTRVSRLSLLRFFAAIFTLGIVLFFWKKPVSKKLEKPKRTAPFTFIEIMGPRPVLNGIRELVDRGILRMEEMSFGYRDEPEDVIFPTPRLVNILMGQERFSEN